MSEIILTWAPPGTTHTIDTNREYILSLARYRLGTGYPAAIVRPESDTQISLPVSGYVTDFRARVAENNRTISSGNVTINFRLNGTNASSFNIGPGAIGEFSPPWFWQIFFPAYVSWGDDANSSILLPGTAGSTADGDITIPVILVKIDTDYTPPGLWPWFRISEPRFFMLMSLQPMGASAMMTGDLANYARMSLTEISQLPLEQLAKIASVIEQRRTALAATLASSREARSPEWSKITQWNLSTCQCKMLCNENWKELKFIHRCKRHQSSKMTEMDVWNEQRDKSSKKAANNRKEKGRTPRGTRHDRKRKSRR